MLRQKITFHNGYISKASLADGARLRAKRQLVLTMSPYANGRNGQVSPLYGFAHATRFDLSF